MGRVCNMVCQLSGVRALALCLCLPGLLAQIVGPKYKPGDTMMKTDHESVDNALDDVVKAGGITEGRRCAIGFANKGSTELTNPEWYVHGGRIYSSAPYTIPKRQTGLTLFHKKSVSTYGTNGLISYEIANTDFKLVILWEIPWNYLMYAVKYNVKIYKKNVPTGKDLFNHIYKYAGTPNSSGWLERNEYGIKLMATITESSYAKLYVSIDDSSFSSGGSPELHAACDLNGWWFGNYCWQECVPRGYCWINKKCSSDSDCVSPMECYDSCKSS